MIQNPAYHTVIITSVTPETAGVFTFTLTYIDGTDIAYQAGQFITFVFAHHGREERRSYSISSSPAQKEPLSFTVKRIDNGAYSRLLADRARVGDLLQTTGVGGLFTSADSANFDQFFFFAAGIGITPIISLIKTLLYTQTANDIVLVYSNRSREDVVFYDELQLLAQTYPDRFRLEILYSTSFNLQRARLNKSLLGTLLREYGHSPWEKIAFYLCGPFSYMRMAIIALEELGIHQDQVKKENFNTTDRQVRKASPPDVEAHHVTIHFNNNNYTFLLQYPDTILTGAKKNGLNLPYSCEAGQCGSCMARCTEGTIWHSNNEVLTEKDLRQGRILTCTGYPVGGDVKIELP